MASSRCSDVVRDVDELRAELNHLSARLQTTSRDERPGILRRMWELSGQIAEAREYCA